MTIDRYFQLTPEKLSSLLDDNDDLFNTLLKPSIEFLNLMNIIIRRRFHQIITNISNKTERRKIKIKTRIKTKTTTIIIITTLLLTD